MRRFQKNNLPRTRAVWQLPCLLCALAVAGAAVAQQVAAPAAVDHSYGRAHAGPTRYRVINLGSGPLSTLPKINATGQVVFSINPGPASRGYFYDGAAVQDIGTLGGPETLATDLNNTGQVTGGSILANGSEHAFVWRAASGMLDLGVLPGAANARAAAINNLGVVTGTAEGFSLVRAFRWSAASGMEDLGAYTPGLGSFSSGSALNDAGLITGASTTPGGERQAFAWTRTGGLVDIDTLGSLDSDGSAVGARGEVAGSRIPAGDSLYRAFFWTRATGMLDLGTAGGNESFAIAMSPNARIAGLINLDDGYQRAFSWTRAGGMRNLGTLGGRSSRAIEVNNRGQVVGFAWDREQAFRAFVWSAATGMVDLNTRLRHAPPGLVLDDAVAINDSGAIVATSNAGLVLLRPGHGPKGGHAVGPIRAPQRVRPGTPLQASVGWVDEDGVGTRSVSWSWGDGSVGAGRVHTGDAGAGSASASHSYAQPGIYPVTATVVDRSGRSTAVGRSVLVAPAGGVVAGSGAVMSPPGAFAASPLLAGKAKFSLVAPAADDAQAADSGRQGQLQFDLPGLSLRSDSLRLLTRQGGQHVFEGSGTVGGAGGYRLRLATTAGASGGVSGGAPGRFGLTIWRTDPVSRADVVVYDNQRAQAGRAAGTLVEGSIVTQ
jgi:probable HAF family extracellular repeat protein